jgi:hypothetical protein
VPATVPQLLDGACGILRRQARIVVPAVLLVGIPAQALAVLARHAVNASADRLVSGDLFNTDPSNAPTGGETATVYAVFFLRLLAVMLVGAVLAHVAVADRLGPPTTLGAALKAGLRRWPALALAFLLGHLLMVAGGCALVGTPVFVTLFCVTAPAIVLEDLSAWGGLKRSWALTLRRFWPCLGFVLLSGLVGTLISYSLGALPLVLSIVGPLQHVDWAMSALADQLGDVVAVPVVALATTLLYLDLRVRTEGLDLTLAQRSAPAPGAPGSG